MLDFCWWIMSQIFIKGEIKVSKRGMHSSSKCMSWHWFFFKSTVFFMDFWRFSFFHRYKASLSSIKISLLRLYPWTSVPVSIKGAAGCWEYTIFHSKREGSHLIKKGRGKTLAGQWERSRIDQPASHPHHIIFVWQHHPKVGVHRDFSWTERLTSNTRLKRGCRILAGPNENINC